MEEILRDSCIGLSWVGRTGYEGTSVDEIDDLFARNWAMRVVRCDTVLIIPVAGDLNVADIVNLLCVVNITKNKIGAGLDPNPVHVGAWCDFRVGRR